MYANIISIRRKENIKMQTQQSDIMGVENLRHHLLTTWYKSPQQPHRYILTQKCIIGEIDRRDTR